MTEEDVLLGRIALHFNLVTAAQLQQALEVPGQPVAQALLGLKLISSEQHAWLLNARAQYLAKQGAPTAPAASPPVAPPAASVPSPMASAPRPPMPSAPPPRAEGPAWTGSGALTLKSVLARAVELGASDVHLHTGSPLQLRIHGALKELRTGVLDAATLEGFLAEALSPGDLQQLREVWELDTAVVVPSLGRFRASFYRQQHGWDMVFRPIRARPPSLAELGLPRTLEKLVEHHQGLVLVTGPAGSGKSSTLAALVNLLNEKRSDHIITVEDPIEFIHQPKGCLVNQRQAGRHTRSFANALRAALREDPDIIVIGELRDLETISLAITAAETGHLVLGTLHTSNATRTINRILDVFPPAQQGQIRAMVSESLRGVVSQRLLPTADGKGRVPALEVLFVKPAVSNLIREEKTFQLRSVMQTGRAEGNCLLDDSLAELLKAGAVTREEVRRHAEDLKRFP